MQHANVVAIDSLTKTQKRNEKRKQAKLRLKARQAVDTSATPATSTPATMPVDSQLLSKEDQQLVDMNF